MNHLPPIPARMKSLPVESRGYPVPWFVAWFDGKPDFRVMDAARWREAIAFKRCWLCGETLGRFLTFVVGPMCAVNRTTAEPPSHLECAEFAARACPFLAMPKAMRREVNAPGVAMPAGMMLMRNPGVCLLWTTRDMRLFRAQAGEAGRLIEMGKPTAVRWLSEGREATRGEVLGSIDKGFPSLAAMCATPEEFGELETALAQALTLAPPLGGSGASAQ